MKKMMLALGLCSVWAGSAHAAEWGYEGEHGPNHWGKVASECALGKNQSPIDIQSTMTAKLDALEVNYKGQVSGIKNNGHTIQGVVEGDNTFVVEGKQYSLLQFHFHTPSENLVKGRSFPLEAHFVNADSEGNLAVIAVMYDLANEPNVAMSSLLEQIPTEGESSTLSRSLSIATLLPSLAEYYRFNGSLTTPPCSEGVRWYVLKDHSTLQLKQVKALMSVMGKNNRPIQQQNARVILKN